MKVNKYGLGILTAALLCGFEANAYETAARNAILMDYDTGEYLFENPFFRECDGLYFDE